ncbi:gag/pol protein [Cucumis melo var. makuwa]|uniref:Gag/pol protein n=1 Tax=Cucumis melo var. makuwa TaxID=1194695 RepID=A0A5A7TV00_CUCMM|nr:gag/pol protein [Cucumis melo var. makuwa]TYK04813.1 gag/pol protein [Cucumis melo var. makuwa]
MLDLEESLLVSPYGRFVLVEECPQVSTANATQIVREAYERWVKANEKARAYILASLSKIKHDALKYIFNAHMNEEASVREHVLNMMVHFNVAEMNEAIIDEASQGEANVVTSTRKFHRGSTSGTKSLPSSSGTKK